MKVTKQGVTFTNDEMRDFVFPMIRQGLSKQLDGIYDKGTPRCVKKSLKEALEKQFAPYANTLSEATKVKLLDKNKRGVWGLTIWTKEDPVKFNYCGDNELVIGDLKHVPNNPNACLSFSAAKIFTA